MDDIISTPHERSKSIASIGLPHGKVTIGHLGILFFPNPRDIKPHLTSDIDIGPHREVYTYRGSITITFGHKVGSDEGTKSNTTYKNSYRNEYSEGAMGQSKTEQPYIVVFYLP